MKLARWLSTTAATFLAAATLVAGPAAASATAAPAVAAAPAAALAPTAPKYFLGSGYGPLDIATDAAWNTAYAQAAQEGYPAADCARSAGPVAAPVGAGGYYQVTLEIYCVPPPPPAPGRSSACTPASAWT